MFDAFLNANAKYAEGFALQGIAAVAARGFALVTCMDSRIEPLTMLGLYPGDAKILRNGGARVTPDVLRSLILATHFLGVTRIAVMQHTDCALANQTDGDVRARLGDRGMHGVDEWEFLAMPDPDGDLRSDVSLVRDCPQLPDGVRVEGWRYDVATGRILRLVPS